MNSLVRHKIKRSMYASRKLRYWRFFCRWTLFKAVVKTPVPKHIFTQRIRPPKVVWEMT